MHPYSITTINHLASLLQFSFSLLYRTAVHNNGQGATAAHATELESVRVHATSSYFRHRRTTRAGEHARTHAWQRASPPPPIPCLAVFRPLSFSPHTTHHLLWGYKMDHALVSETVRETPINQHEIKLKRGGEREKRRIAEAQTQETNQNQKAAAAPGRRRSEKNCAETGTSAQIDEWKTETEA